MHFRYDINGLRALAVLSVVIFHFAEEKLPGGFIGVDVFFVISWYLMTSIIINKLDKDRFRQDLGGLLNAYQEVAARLGLITRESQGGTSGPVLIKNQFRKFIMKATVKITLKYGVLDPQGKAIEKSLVQLGFSGVNEVRQGKLIELDIDADTPEAAEKQITEMCEKLLANTVIENYDIQLNLAD